MTLTEAAEYLQVHRTTIYKLVKSGDLPYRSLKPGGGRRFLRSDLDALLKEGQ